MEFCNTLTPHYKLEYFESSMDLCPLESFKGFSERNSISPLSESNRTVDECIHCNDRPDYECTECTCQICGHKTKAAKRYRCFSCKKVFHEWCQNIPDATLTTDHWECMNCKPKDLVPAGNDVSSVVKKYTRQIIIRTAVTTRKINNAPRSKECTIVPANHFGPIPNIPVGTCWEYRLQASEAGVHRPLVAGIHGRENEGAYSIVISGVYPDDFDNGDEFFYSGSGGKEKDPSKRLGAQVRNQMLTKQNRALALCCDCPLNDKEGGKAKNWRNGKPVRVIRNYKLAKFSKYAPTEGNRYDGIYKVVKYFPQKGHSGYMIWRYLLKRDDPTPAPWTTEGKRMIAQMGIKMIKASPSIVEKAEEYESTTIKLEINDEDPMKKTIKRVRRKPGDLYPPPPPKRPLEITISSPKHSPKYKEERLSPPPTPETMIASEEDIKRTPPRISEYPSIGELKSSPTHEPMTPASIESSEIEDHLPNGANSYLQMTSMAERSCVSNTTYAEPPVLAHSSSCISTSQNVLTNSTAFTQSMSSLSYLDNAYMPPIALPKPTYLTNSITSTFANQEKPYFPSGDLCASPKYLRQPEPLPIMKLPLPNMRSSDINDFGFKPIKLSKPTKPIALKPDPGMPEHQNQSTMGSETNKSWELSHNIKDLIGKDVLNRGWWDMCIEKYLPLGKQNFMEKVSQIFTCPCCHKITDKPVTLKCENRHSACLACMSHRFEVFRVRSCPSCQEPFGPSTKLKINENLSSILLALFPDYNLNLSYLI